VSGSAVPRVPDSTTHLRLERLQIKSDPPGSEVPQLARVVLDGVHVEVNLVGAVEVGVGRVGGWARVV